MFVRGGYVYSDNYLNRAGFDGNHWSSIGFYDAIAYALVTSFPLITTPDTLDFLSAVSPSAARIFKRSSSISKIPKIPKIPS